MSTVIRPVISEKNKYRLEKHRYYELKHFCLQYRNWKMEYESLGGDTSMPPLDREKIQTSHIFDSTADIAIVRTLLKKNIDMIDRISEQTDPVLGMYVKQAVTEGISFVNLKTRFQMPCERDMFYDRYRKFFWLLSREKE